MHVSERVDNEPAQAAESVHTSPEKLTTALAASALLSACGGGGGGGTAAPSGTGPGPATPSAPAGASFTAATTDEEAARFLLQAQFSASDAEIAAVRNKSYATWLAEQFAAPTSTSGFDWLNQRGYGTINSSTNYYDNSYPGDYMLWNQLMTSSDAVRKRMALALSEFFVVSLSEIGRAHV